MQRINYYERQKIEVYLRMNKTKKWIAKTLNRDYSVIKREIKRNSGNYLPYTAKEAQRISERRAKITNQKKLEKDENKSLRKFIIDMIKEDNSPEAIAGRLKHNLPEEVKDSKDKTISHETIYNYIYNGKGKWEYLYPHLRTKRPKRRKWHSRKHRSSNIKNRVSIHFRDKLIDNKERLGDWETDLVLFHKQKEVLSVKYERKTQLVILHKVKNKTASEFEKTIEDTIKSLPPNTFLTVTRDNGTENAKHEETKIKYGIQSYFCDPYSSWQKGGVENMNKLIRQYLPRDIDFSKVTDEELRIIQEKLNNRFRKNNNYLTPNELFARELKKGH